MDDSSGAPISKRMRTDEGNTSDVEKNNEESSADQENTSQSGFIRQRDNEDPSSEHVTEEESEEDDELLIDHIARDNEEVQEASPVTPNRWLVPCVQVSGSAMIEGNAHLNTPASVGPIPTYQHKDHAAWPLLPMVIEIGVDELSSGENSGYFVQSPSESHIEMSHVAEHVGETEIRYSSRIGDKGNMHVMDKAVEKES